MKLIELTNYTLDPIGKGYGLRNFSCAIDEGDLLYIEGDRFDDVHLFLRALATLERPVEGVFRYRGEPLDFSDYRKLLPFKSRVGFLSADATLLSNRTLGENIMWGSYFREGHRSLKVADEALRLCRLFDIEDKLHLRPSQVFRDEVRAAVIVRELVKGAEILLVEPARDVMSRVHYDAALKLLEEAVSRKMTIVFSTGEEEVVRGAATKKVRIAGGRLDVAALT